MASHHDVDVAIVGAGAAGIAAARELQARGRSFRLLEARERVGGRLWTDRSALGLPFDLGGSWIHAADRGNPWSDIALALGARFCVDPRRRFVARGRSLDAEAGAALGEAIARAVAGVEAAAAATGGASLGELLPRDAEFADTVRKLLGIWITGVEPEEVDARDWISTESGEDWIPVNGYGALLERVAARVPVQLGCVVERLVVAPDHVRIETSEGSFRAAHVILTVSTELLRRGRPQVHPEWPAEIAAALETLPLGHAEKIGLLFEGDPFGLGDSWFLYPQPGSGELLYVMRPCSLDLAWAFAGGSCAREIAAMDEDDVHALVKEDLARQAGHAVARRLRKTVHSRWSTDYWALGAYSYATPGAAGARELLRRPVLERLHLAGEASAPAGWQATAAGAYLAGRRAARTIDQLLSGWRGGL